MTPDRAAWPPDFPRVAHFIDHNNVFAMPWKMLAAHPDYNAAKNRGDRHAAARLVRDFMDTPENAALLKSIKNRFPSALIVPVHAIEEHGKNRIPEALAEYIAKNTGLGADTAVVQSNVARRTGAGPWARLAFRPAFDGPVSPGRPCVLVDDVFTHGGSFSELRRHILKGGGSVVLAASLSCGGSGDVIAPRPDIQKHLLDIFGKNNLNSFLKEFNLYDGNCAFLTEPEALALRKAASLDEAGNRIVAARQERGSRNIQEAVRGREAPLITRASRR
jgi:hypothetical protein